MTHGKVRYSDFAVIDAILVCLNHSKNYHTGIYYYCTCFIYTDISRQSELLLPQIICRVAEGFVVFCLVLVLLWSNEACRRNKQKYEGKNQPHVEAILLQLDKSHMRKACIKWFTKNCRRENVQVVWIIECAGCRLQTCSWYLALSRRRMANLPSVLVAKATACHPPSGLITPWWMTTLRSCSTVSVRRISFGTILMVELLWWFFALAQSLKSFMHFFVSAFVYLRAKPCCNSLKSLSTMVKSKSLGNRPQSVELPSSFLASLQKMHNQWQRDLLSSVSNIWSLYT